MTDTKKLSYLLKLLDDESPLVQEAVTREIRNMGHALEVALSQVSPAPNPEERKILQRILTEQSRSELKRLWPSWFSLKTEHEKLEKALSLISHFQTGIIYPVPLSELLNQLVSEYKKLHSKPDAYRLAYFLFKTKGIKGAEKDYHNPANSNLVYVIQEKKGIPISLANIYILVGARLGLSIEGCNYPGHFMAKTMVKDKLFFVDCFNNGRFLDEADILTPDSPVMMKKALHMKTDMESIMMRVLNNLYNAYERNHDQANSQLIAVLRESLEKKMKAALPST